MRVNFFDLKVKRKKVRTDLIKSVTKITVKTY